MQTVNNEDLTTFELTTWSLIHSVLGTLRLAVVPWTRAAVSYVYETSGLTDASLYGVALQIVASSAIAYAVGHGITLCRDIMLANAYRYDEDAADFYSDGSKFVYVAGSRIKTVALTVASSPSKDDEPRPSRGYLTEISTSPTMESERGTPRCCTCRPAGQATCSKSRASTGTRRCAWRVAWRRIASLTGGGPRRGSRDRAR